MKQRRLPTTLILLGVLGTPAIGFAQPEPDGTAKVQPGKPAGEPAEGPAKERVAARIVKALEDVERMRTWLNERQTRLDAGESPQRIAAELEVATRMLAAAGRGPGEGRGWRGDGPFQDRNANQDRGEDAETPAFDNERAMVFLREHMPRLARRMEELRERDAAMTDRFLTRMAPRLREIESVRRRDPQLFTLRVAEFQTTPDVVDAMRLYREALAGRATAGDAPVTIAAAETQLRDAIRRQFEARLAVQRHELEALQAQVARLEQEMAEKQDRQSAYIDEAIARLRNAPERDDRGGEKRGGEGRNGDGRRPPR